MRGYDGEPDTNQQRELGIYWQGDRGSLTPVTRNQRDSLQGVSERRADSITTHLLRGGDGQGDRDTEALRGLSQRRVALVMPSGLVGDTSREW